MKDPTTYAETFLGKPRREVQGLCWLLGLEEGNATITTSKMMTGTIYSGDLIWWKHDGQIAVGIVSLFLHFMPMNTFCVKVSKHQLVQGAVWTSDGCGDILINYDCVETSLARRPVGQCVHVLWPTVM